MLQLWYKFLELPKISPKFITALLQFEYNDRIKERYDFCIKRNVIKIRDFTKYYKSTLDPNNSKKAQKMRSHI